MPFPPASLCIALHVLLEFWVFNFLKTANGKWLCSFLICTFTVFMATSVTPLYPYKVKSTKIIMTHPCSSTLPQGQSSCWLQFYCVAVSLHAQNTASNDYMYHTTRCNHCRTYHQTILLACQLKFFLQ